MEKVTSWVEATVPKVKELIMDPMGNGAVLYLIVLGVGILFAVLLGLSLLIDGPSKKKKRVDPVIKEAMEKTTPTKRPSRGKVQLGSTETPDGRRQSTRVRKKPQKKL